MPVLSCHLVPRSSLTRKLEIDMPTLLCGLTARHSLKHWLCIGLTLCALAAQGQEQTADTDWKETDTPAPPTFKTTALIAIEMPRYVTLRFGVDPDTITLTPDGIVRYVMVAVNTSGSVNAMYEGLRCATGQVKTYARAGSSGVWSVVKTPEWRDLSDNLPSKHAIAFARQGVCEGRSVNGNSAANLVRALKK